MRGTVLKLKSKLDSMNSNNQDFEGSWSDLDDNEHIKEEINEISFDCGVNGVDTFNVGSPPNQNNTEDEEKRTLMSTLNLKNTHSPSSKSQLPQQCKRRTRSFNVPGSTITCLTATPHSPLPIFKWDDINMWKAMSEHPLFPKYMELQSELNELFEIIRGDCKNAACEKAFASLVKDLNYSSKPLTSKYVITNNPVDTNEPIPIPKKRGRPPLKFKGGPPRKRGRPPLKSYSTENVACSSGNLNSKEFSPSKGSELVKSPPRGTIRTTRRSVDSPVEEGYSRKRCKNCFRIFSVAKWFEKHIAICTSVGSPGKNEHCESEGLSRNNDEKDYQEGYAPELSSFKAEAMDEVEKEQFVESTISPCVSTLSSSPKVSSEVYDRDGGSENKYVPRTPLVPISPSSQTSPAGCYVPSRIQSQNSSNCNIWDCSPQKASRLECDGCFRCFTYRASLEKHRRLCVKREKTVSSSTNMCDSDEEEHETDLTTLSKEENSECRSEVSSGDGDKNLECEDRQSCNSCQKVFLKFGMLERHETVCHLNRNQPATSELYSYTCEKCSRSFISTKKLWQHQAFCCPEMSEESQHWIKHLKCMKCSRRFPNYKKQLKHRAHCCPDRETNAKVCQKCFKVFLMKDRMLAHQAHCSQDR